MTDLPATRNSLLIELGKRSDSAWSEFLNVYENAILRFCISRGLQEADALDAAQAVYAAIYQKMGSWEHGSSRGSFRAWLFRVARNVTVDLIVARGRLATTGDAGQAELQAIQDHRIPDAAASDHEHSTAFQLELRRALFEWASRQVEQEVRQSTWEAFCLTAIDGRKAEDVAAALGISVGSVYTAKCRVMSRIRDKVMEWDAEDGKR